MEISTYLENIEQHGLRASSFLSRTPQHVLLGIRSMVGQVGRRRGDIASPLSTTICFRRVTDSVSPHGSRRSLIEGAATS